MAWIGGGGRRCVQRHKPDIIIARCGTCGDMVTHDLHKKIHGIISVLCISRVTVMVCDSVCMMTFMEMPLQ